MKFVGEWFRRLHYLINRRQLERDLQREMETHRAMMGEPVRFGNTLRLREEAGDVWGWNWLDSACHDVRFAARMLRRSPGFTLGATLVLSLGIGLNLTLFEIYNGVFLRPPAVLNLETLVSLDRMSNNPGPVMSYRAIRYIADNNNVLSAVLPYIRQRDVLWEDFQDRVSSTFVSANWFDEVGTPAAAGRVFHEATDSKADAVPVVVLSHRFWKRRLGSNPNVVGSTVRINDRRVVVIGIMPRDYAGGPELDDAQMWMPIETIDYFFQGTTLKTEWRASTLVRMYARLRPGVSLATARQSLRLPMDELAEQHPQDFRKGEWLEPIPGTERFESPRDRTQRLLNVTAFGFLSLLVLAVACANLGNLVLSRAIGRMRELSVRIALGASRWRVMRHLLAESALLAGMACIAAVAISYSVINIAADAWDVPPIASVDWRTIVAALAVSTFAMIVVGFLPTWVVSRRDLNSAMKDGGQNASAGLGRTRLRSLLTAVQVAGSCILLALAGLTARSVQRALTPGFAFDKVAVLDVSTRSFNIDARSYWSAVRQSIASIPDTEEVALIDSTPFGNGVSMVEGLPESPALAVTMVRTDPQFFSLMRIRMVLGRTFELSDDAERTAVVSRRLAMELYGTLDVLGRQFPRTPWRNDRTSRTIVGVVEDAHLIQIEVPNGAEVYFPMDPALRRVSLLVRSKTDATSLLGPMRDAAHRVDNRLTPDARLLATDFRNRLKQAALLGGIAASLALLTLLLSSIGVFGVVSYGASLRVKEICIRLALGAKRSSVLVLLMKQSARPGLLGMFCGVLVSLIASRILQAQRVHLGTLDAPMLVSIVLILVTTGGVAALLPALRALRRDIVQPLRNE